MAKAFIQILISKLITRLLCLSSDVLREGTKGNCPPAKGNSNYFKNNEKHDTALVNVKFFLIIDTC